MAIKWLMHFLVALFLLNGCVKTKVIKEYIYVGCEIPPIPEKPEMIDVKWIKIGKYYCLDKDKAKKLMINIYRLDSYSTQLRKILEGLKEK